MIDWSLYKNFSKAEFDCTHCGANQMTPAFMAKLQALRMAYGKPMRITSGFRCAQHPVEAALEGFVQPPVVVFQVAVQNQKDRKQQERQNQEPKHDKSSMLPMKTIWPADPFSVHRE